MVKKLRIDWCFANRRDGDLVIIIKKEEGKNSN